MCTESHFCWSVLRVSNPFFFEQRKNKTFICSFSCNIVVLQKIFHSKYCFFDTITLVIIFLICDHFIFIIAATSFHEYCEENEQCSAFLIGSSCRNNSCSCSEDQHGFGSLCVRSARLGGVCSGVEECISDNKYSQIVNCIDGTCKCLPGVIDETLGCSGCSRDSGILVLVVGAFFLSIINRI